MMRRAKSLNGVEDDDFLVGERWGVSDEFSDLESLELG